MRGAAEFELVLIKIGLWGIERIYGDGGYQGPKAARAATKTGYWTIEIVNRSPAAVGFEVLPKRWIVERTFAWLSRFRRLARDFERYGRTVAAFIRLAMIRIMLKRLVANPSSCPSSTVRFTKYLNKHGNPSRAGGLALHFRWGGIRTLRRRGWSAAARRRRPAGPGWQPGAAPSE